MAQPLTKKDLNEALESFATKQDFKELTAKMDGVETSLADKIAVSEERLAESIRGMNFRSYPTSQPA